MPRYPPNGRGFAALETVAGFFLRRLLQAIRANWPRTEILLRGSKAERLDPPKNVSAGSAAPLGQRPRPCPIG
ncbi:protein of unknown function [Methylocella tundrae]|uniref:Uncharacterized protein n=1 Tax=Methylocella tundrae TaxID=227605 RepID=A0A4U8Z1B2_METTU|nr:protein of unknown function [Methylocella tundrae]